jgi:putative peptide zinc metalloprotease protein
MQEVFHMTELAAPTIKLVDISIKKDKKNYIVEDRERQEFYEMPELCIEAIKLIQEGMSLSDIEVKLRAKHPGEEVDMHDFIQQLWDLGLLRSWDDRVAEAPSIALPLNNSVSKGWKMLGSILFHPITVAIYAILFIANLGQLIYEPLLMPNYTDMFITGSMMINICIWTVFGLTAVFLHECGHSLAMAARGLASSWQISNRLFIPVVETDMTPLWSLPSKQRVVPLLAGMCVDQVLLFLVLGLQWVLPETSMLVPWLKMLSLQLLLALGYQMMFFMKTDMYYIVQNDTGCYNLMENAQLWLKGLFFRGSRRQAVSETYAGELPVIRVYSLLYIVGVGVSLFILFTFILPQMQRAIQLTWPRLGISPAEPLFWDAAVFYMQLLVLAGWLTYAWTRSAIRRRAHG